uniref:Uncharacterized protein n=1 Tax=Spongospora subterranea TaxID=70186 RepID=A0A0H5R226_9EUKA|eukprot:CRZ08267.1 hypothetical protein [Spongospora subterranea]
MYLPVQCLLHRQVLINFPTTNRFGQLTHGHLPHMSGHTVPSFAFPPLLIVEQAASTMMMWKMLAFVCIIQFCQSAANDDKAIAADHIRTIGVQDAHQSPSFQSLTHPYNTKFSARDKPSSTSTIIHQEDWKSMRSNADCTPDAADGSCCNCM